MTGYELRPARESDAEGICALWGGVFGDGEGFVREFLRVFGPGCGLVAVRGGSVAAMGFCPLGPEAAGYACGYIYAMATHPEHRGRGLAGEIALGLRARPSSAARTSSRRSRPAGASRAGTPAGSICAPSSARAARASYSPGAGWISPPSAARTTPTRRIRSSPRRGPASIWKP